MSSFATVIKQPTAEPVTLARARAWLAIDVEGFLGATLLDPELESMIRGARQWIEKQINQSIGVQTLMIAAESFYHLGSRYRQSALLEFYSGAGYPSACRSGIDLPCGPVRSIVSIQYLTSDGFDLTVDPATYRLTQFGTPQQAVLRAGMAWPEASLEPESVRVTYIAGYDVGSTTTTVVENYADNYADGYTGSATTSSGGDGTMPLGDDLIIALRMQLGNFWRNREATSDTAMQEVPLGVRALLATNRAGLGV